MAQAAVAGPQLSLHPLRPLHPPIAFNYPMAKKQADGNHVIYHYLQKVVGVRDDPQSRQIITQLLTDLSIWLPPNLYRELPILLPFCLRDPSCRKSGPNGEDEWGSATPAGFLRDDNSLLKGVVASFVIRSPKIDVYNNAKRGRGFVASHVWREITLNGQKCLASRRPETYTFVPNVAWLPSQLSKLTDREGSLAQKVLQALSHQIYGPHRNCHPPFIASLWTALPRPEVEIEVDTKQLNYFVAEDTWIQRRKRDLLSEMDRIRHTIRTRRLPAKKVKCSRYLPSLLEAIELKEGELLDWLNQYESLLTAGDSAAEP